VIAICLSACAFSAVESAHTGTVAREAVRGSFDGAVARATGVTVAERQAVALTRAAAVDVEAFYAQVKAGPTDKKRLLMSRFDGKGAVMRPEGLRPATSSGKSTQVPAGRYSFSLVANTAAWVRLVSSSLSRMAET
jgi:hypothetical protein